MTILAACGVAPVSGTGGSTPSAGGLGPAPEVVVLADADGDGYNVPFDCDDADPASFPGAAEACDGVDNDCDGARELDVDADGFLGCEECDDHDPTRFPGAPDPVDGWDQDCDRVDGTAALAGLAVSGGSARTGEHVEAVDLDGDGDDELVVDVFNDALIVDHRPDGFVTSVLGPLDEQATDARVVAGPAPRIVTIASWANRLALHDPVGSTWPAAPTASLLLDPLAGTAASVAAAGDWVGVYTVGLQKIEVLLVPADLAADVPTPAHTLFVSDRGFLGASTDTLLGSAGDRDGDGLTDLAVTCCRADISPDSIRVVTPGLEAHVDDAAELWGSAGEVDVVSLGHQDGVDVDGDGRPELVLGSPSTLGLVPYVGPGAHRIEDHAVARVEWVEPQPPSAVDDVDGDGLADLVTVVSSATVDGTDAAVLHLGPLAGTLEPQDAAQVIVGGYAADWFRASVALGDVDGDDKLDLAVGAPYDQGNGAVFLLSDLAGGL